MDYEAHRDTTGRMVGLTYYNREVRINDRVLAGENPFVPKNTPGLVVGFDEVATGDFPTRGVIKVVWDGSGPDEYNNMKIRELCFLDQITITKNSELPFH